MTIEQPSNQNRKHRKVLGDAVSHDAAYKTILFTHLDMEKLERRDMIASYSRMINDPDYEITDDTALVAEKIIRVPGRIFVDEPLDSGLVLDVAIKLPTQTEIGEQDWAAATAQAYRDRQGTQ